MVRLYVAPVQKTACNFFWQFSLIIALLGIGDQTGLALTMVSVVPIAIDGSNYNINLFAISYVPPSGTTDDSLLGPLISVTKDGEAVPFTTINTGGGILYTNSDGASYIPLGYYIFTATNVPPDAFSLTYTFTWQQYYSNSVAVTNYTEDLKAKTPAIKPHQGKSRQPPKF